MLPPSKDSDTNSEETTEIKTYETKDIKKMGYALIVIALWVGSFMFIFRAKVVYGVTRVGHVAQIPARGISSWWQNLQRARQYPAQHRK